MVGHDHAIIPHTVSVVHLNPEMSCLSPAQQFSFLGIRLDYELPRSVNIEWVSFPESCLSHPQLSYKALCRL